MGLPIQQIKSLARWSTAVVERYLGDAVLSTLSSHVRRARSFQSAVYCPASFVAAPIGADQGPSHMGPDEDACTAASLDHLFERLQTLEAADQLRSNSVLPVVVNIRRSGWRSLQSAICSLRSLSRVYAGSSHALPFLCPRPVLEQRAAVTWVQMAPLQLHTWPKTRKRVGRWVRWSVYCDLQLFLWSIDLCGKHSQVWSLAGAAHLLNDNAGVLLK